MEIGQEVDLQQVVMYRSKAEACECLHLKRSPILRPTEALRPVKVMEPRSTLLLPHELPKETTRMIPTTLWPVGPPCGMICEHPANVGWARAAMPRECQAGTTFVEVTLEFCQTCPLHEVKDKV
jgi:hypothetical protein